MTTQVKKFALIGVGGYIAGKHLQAIKDTGNILVASMDKSDSVGILDSYFPSSEFFTEYERFERYIEKNKNDIDYLVVCTPNYLHDTHIRLGLNSDIDVICEKPLVVNKWNLDSLWKLSQSAGRSIYAILQMRLHPKIEEIRNYLSGRTEAEIEYNVNRGKWYERSWKWDVQKSGGLIYNIGIHFLDTACYLFGKPLFTSVDGYCETSAKGSTLFEKMNVKWTLSLNAGKPRRLIRIEDKEFDFTDGFTDLHTKSYDQILYGSGFTIEDAGASIDLASQIRSSGERLHSPYKRS